MGGGSFYGVQVSAASAYRDHGRSPNLGINGNDLRVVIGPPIPGF